MKQRRWKQIIALMITASFFMQWALGQADHSKHSQGLFEIMAHNDRGFRETDRKVVVFGIPIYAYKEVEEAKLLHAANLMAQYLDNDEDGVVDNPTLLRALQENEAKLFMWKFENQIRLPAQDLGADETRPEWHKNKRAHPFDAALEEIWHVLTHSGYAKAYPEIFGEQPGTQLTKALDQARGGRFMEVPSRYPEQAWFTYDDETCSYECMAAEYFYWAMTSILGAQAERSDEIGQEWKLHTKELVEKRDQLIYTLLTTAEYKLPKVLPDGRYRQQRE